MKGLEPDIKLQCEQTLLGDTMKAYAYSSHLSHRHWWLGWIILHKILFPAFIF